MDNNGGPVDSDVQVRLALALIGIAALLIAVGFLGYLAFLLQQ